MTNTQERFDREIRELDEALARLWRKLQLAADPRDRGEW